MHTAANTHLLHHAQTAIETQDQVLLVRVHLGKRSLAIEIGHGQAGRVEGHAHLVEDCHVSEQNHHGEHPLYETKRFLDWSARLSMACAVCTALYWLLS